MPARQNRVTRGDEYRRIVRQGIRVGGALCMAHAVSLSVPSDSQATDGADAGASHPARFGFIITKAIGGAVQRNLVRRRMKAVADELLASGVTDMAIVFRAFPAALHADYATLKQEMFRQVNRLARQVKGKQQ